MSKHYIISLVSSTILVCYLLISCSQSVADNSSFTVATDTITHDSADTRQMTFLNCCGKTIKIESYILDTVDSSWVLYSAVLNTFDTKGLIDSSMFFMADLNEMDIMPIELDINNYDESGRIIESRHCTFCKLSGWENVNKFQYKYVDSNLFSEAKFIWQPETKNWQRINEKYYNYDSLGNKEFCLEYALDPYDTTKIIKNMHSFK